MSRNGQSRLKSDTQIHLIDKAESNFRREILCRKLLPSHLHSSFYDFTTGVLCTNLNLSHVTCHVIFFTLQASANLKLNSISGILMGLLLSLKTEP
jgi:hypothetical protein